MRDSQFSWRMAHDMLILGLALFLTLLSVGYQRPDASFCRGLLGAGFPFPVVCDASGESPLSSVGKIDVADTDSPSITGGLSDVVFYGALLWRQLRKQAPAGRDAMQE